MQRRPVATTLGTDLADPVAQFLPLMIDMKHSLYMQWAKERSGAKYKLALSGFPDQSLDVLPTENLALHGPNSYGYAPLCEKIAARYGVEPENVVTAWGGTSFANHLALASVLERGDEVLLEQPVYEPILQVLNYLGANVRRFARRREEDFRLDLTEIAHHLTPRTRLIVLTNLHNPSSALTDNETLRELGALARSVGARVVVDEVYLDAMYAARPASAATLGDEFIVTASLTKAFGLSGLRCGWILAAPDLAETMRRHNDLYGVVAPHIAECLSVTAFEQLDALAARFAPMWATNRALWQDFADAHQHVLHTPRTAYGTTVFPRLLRGDVATLCQVLRDEYDTTVVPGDYFESPEHFRVGLCGDTATLKKGLENLSAAMLRTLGTCAVNG